MEIEAHDPHHRPRQTFRTRGSHTTRSACSGGTVLGISSVAPAYALTATIGILVAEAGEKMSGDDHRRIPADVLRRLRLPRAEQGGPGLRDVVHLDDQGVRPVRRLDRRWAAILATVIVLSNLAGVAVQFFYQFFGDRVRATTIDRRPVGEQTDQRAHLRGLPGGRHLRSPTAASPPPSRCSSSWSASRW